MNYKHHYQYQNVRPTKVLEAARYLVQTSELFRKKHIEVQQTWEDNVISSSDLTTTRQSNEWEEFLNNHASYSNEMQSTETQTTLIENRNKQQPDSHCTQSDPGTLVDSNDIQNNNNDNDNWCEIEERPSGVTDTLLEQADITENLGKVLSFAPGEGNRPLGIFMDKDSEFLSFPTIYCGETRADNKYRKIPVHYSTVCKWELRSQDRRVAQSVPNIFYKLKKLQIKQIQNSASLSLRKCKTKGKRYTAGDLKSDDYINKLINLDEGFRVLRNLRGSAPYFEKCKKDLFAMIRQLGNPSWFCSFSAAETKWSHLLKILARVVDKRDLSDCEIDDMTWQQKSDLIQKDPVTL